MVEQIKNINNNNIDVVRFYHLVGELYDKNMFKLATQHSSHSNEDDFISNKRIFLEAPYNIPCSFENTHIVARYHTSTERDIADSILLCISNKQMGFVDGILQGMSNYFLEQGRTNDSDFCLMMKGIGRNYSEESEIEIEM